MKKILTLFGKRFFVDTPLYVTLPLFIVWFLALCAALFGGPTIFDQHWVRVGSILLVTVTSMAFFMAK